MKLIKILPLIFVIGLMPISRICASAAASDEIVIVPSQQRVMLNGEFINLPGYNRYGEVAPQRSWINDAYFYFPPSQWEVDRYSAIYVRIRDMAFFLNGTKSQFNVGDVAANNRIPIYPGHIYMPIGNELSPLPYGQRVATKSAWSLTIIHPPETGLLSTGLDLGSRSFEVDGEIFSSLTLLSDLFAFAVSYNPYDSIIFINTNESRIHTANENIAQRFLRELLETGVAKMYSVALDNDGILWGFWNPVNLNRRLTPSPFHKSHTNPEIIMNNVINFAKGPGYVFAITADNTLWGWGFNEFGQLGDGTTQNRFEPVRIMDNVSSIYTTRGFGATRSWDGINGTGRQTFVVRNDGSLYGIASNQYREGAVFTRIADNADYLRGTSWGTTSFVNQGIVYSVEIGGEGFRVNRHINTPENVARIPYVEGAYLIDVNNALWRRDTLVMNGVSSVTGGFQYVAAITTNGELWAWRGSSAFDTQFIWGVELSDTPTFILPNVAFISEQNADIIRSNGDLHLHTLAANAELRLQVPNVRTLNHNFFSTRYGIVTLTDNNLYIVHFGSMVLSDNPRRYEPGSLGARILGNVNTAQVATDTIFLTRAVIHSSTEHPLLVSSNAQPAMTYYYGEEAELLAAAAYHYIFGIMYYHDPTSSFWSLLLPVIMAGSLFAVIVCVLVLVKRKKAYRKRINPAINHAYKSAPNRNNLVLLPPIRADRTPGKKTKTNHSICKSCGEAFSKAMQNFCTNCGAKRN